MAQNCESLLEWLGRSRFSSRLNIARIWSATMVASTIIYSLS